ncbi:MAG: aspartate aminotransferase family protein, partial [Lentisphaeraceae bacterium]|nr:aspartate aminotransferase family protein [Lentisphaeraceae bacterium]
TRIGSMFTLFFHSGETFENVDDVAKCDFDRFGRFFNHMLREEKMLLPPSQYEANFLSCVHTEEHIERYVNGVENFLKLDEA